MSKSSGWGERFTLICAAVAATWAVIEIRDWLKRPEVKLVATVTYGPIPEAPDVAREHEIIQRLRSHDWLEPLKLPYESWIKVRSAMEKLIPESTTRFEGYIHINVNNDGTQAASDVRLTVPGATVLVVSAEGKPGQQIVDAPTLTIGTLPATDSVAVTAFFRGDPSWYTVDEIRLTHAAGVGTKVFKPPKGPDDSWRPWWIPALGFIVCVGFFAVAVWRDMLLNRGRREGVEAAMKAAPTSKEEPPTGNPSP
jgi:hypothetical protein